MTSGLRRDGEVAADLLIIEEAGVIDFSDA
jgi:hypothetical protein